MVVELNRKTLVKEPWITVKNGKVVVRPAIISSISQLPRGHRVDLDFSPSEHSSELARFRIVDDAGPCYEFTARATLDISGVALNIESELEFLR